MRAWPILTISRPRVCGQASPVDGLPQTVPSPWGDQVLSLRYVLPKIWTQKTSRPFGIYWSSSLKYGILHPEPTDGELGSFYDTEGYVSYLTGEKQQRSPLKTTLSDRIIFKLLYMFDRGVDDPVPSILASCKVARPTVCDIGCGSGDFLQRIRPHSAEVLGIDPSPHSGQAVTARGIEFHQGTAEQIPSGVRTKKFDVVTLFHSLEHCRKPKLALANARSLLKRNGLLVVDVPNMDCLGFRTYRQAWYHTDAGRHLHFFTPRSLRALCADLDLTHVAIEYSGFSRQFISQWIAGMDEVWDSLFVESSALGAPPRPSRARSLDYLLRAIFLPARLKYDIFRLYERANTITGGAEADAGTQRRSG
jgi:2-polyprenyl-3-methyl-5-hydroxy-6-metoxy-1,4-benzoquinol methylase